MKKLYFTLIINPPFRIGSEKRENVMKVDTRIFTVTTLKGALRKIANMIANQNVVDDLFGTPTKPSKIRIIIREISPEDVKPALYTSLKIDRRFKSAEEKALYNVEFYPTELKIEGEVCETKTNSLTQQEEELLRNSFKLLERSFIGGFKSRGYGFISKVDIR
ncbi:MAG: RAMP superfamily CRISPR-associated protein [Candidatus Korarchaeota archaeon]